MENRHARRHAGRPWSWAGLFAAAVAAATPLLAQDIPADAAAPHPAPAPVAPSTGPAEALPGPGDALLAAEFSASGAHAAALEAALQQASEPGNPNATVVWGEAPEAAHARTQQDAQGHAFQVGEASWYGADFAGLPTASGEIYDMYAFTVAHPSWPLGSIVRVENLDNGRTALARINDRGPYAFNRILDCSLVIAQSLGFVHHGRAHVRVTLLDSAADAWTRFDGFLPPIVVAQPAPRTPRLQAQPSQTDAVLALAEDLSPPVPAAASTFVAGSGPGSAPELEAAGPERMTFRAASVLPYPAIAHAWDSLSRWLLSPAGDSTRWQRIEGAIDRFGLRGFVRLFTHS